MQEKFSLEPNLLSAVLNARRRHGLTHTIGGDPTRAKFSHLSLFLRGFLLGKPIAAATEDEDYIGVLMPTSLSALVCIITLHMLGKTPCMLNCSAGIGNIRHACNIARVKTILTSRTFAKQAGIEEMLSTLENERHIIYLEDLRDEFTRKQKLAALGKALFARSFLRKTLREVTPEDVAVILYTSGSEGMPKGVALSHKNILANIEQCTEALSLSKADKLFNPLPVFHSFGLTVGLFLPLLIGMRTFFYPSPLHYKQIPPLVRQTGATIFLGTDTFYQGYAKNADEKDFKTVRLAVAGAEKLKETTRQLYLLRFGIDIYQGYGVTETSPVISCNTPEDHHPGTVGRAFYGIASRLEPVEGIAQGGRLFVSGDNVMLGYLKADQPGIIQPQDDWYDTGDIVDIDEEGFIRILGRAKRFAKIGGEMVSLAAVEDLAAYGAPDFAYAAIAAPDERKGEHIVLYTENKELTREQLMQSAKYMGLSELYLPRRVEYKEALPRLASGKIDYLTLQKAHQPVSQSA